MSFFNPGTLAQMAASGQGSILRNGIAVASGALFTYALGHSFTSNINVTSTSWDRVKSRFSSNMLELFVFLGIGYLLYAGEE